MIQTLRIIFMGTPEFAVPCLEALIKDKEHCSVVCVVTKPDMPKGRNYKMTPPPVKETALAAGIPVLQPQKVRTEEFAESLRSFAPDLFVTAAYGRILTQAVLSVPKYGCINVHASLLPKYRGAAPIWHAVINGEKETGITTMMTDAGMDTGDILLADRCEIGENMTMGELHDVLAEMGPVTLMKTLEALRNGTLKRTPQDGSRATYAPMVDRETGRIDWSRSAREIHDLVRGMNPFPGCFAFDSKGGRVKIWRTYIENDDCVNDGRPGRVTGASADGILVAAGKGILRITEIQGESSRRMTAGEYINGHEVTEFA